jgi:hypothetical protein
MSAREDLIRSVYALKNMSQNDMEKLVDAYAHELAEKIRDRQYLPPLSSDEVAFNDILRGAARQIDPEVSDD